MSWIEGVTLSIAVLGAVLGIINTVRAIDSSRVKLRVVPGHAIPVGSAPSSIDTYVAVTNLSSFPITVNEVGYFYRGTDKRAVVMTPVLSDGGPWPRRLEPRSSVSVYCETPESISGHRLRCAYARTDCGVTKKATSPALRQIARERGL